MKKNKIVILLLLVFLLSGCANIFNNEIHNKSYQVEISISEFEELIQAAIEKATPAVVGISNYQSSFLGLQETKTGSGVIYGCQAVMKDGRIEDDCSNTINSDDVKIYKYSVVTNRHVIKGASQIKVYFGETDEFIKASIKAQDSDVDIAILTFDYQAFIQPIEFADSNDLKAGSFAIAIGNPAGHEFYDSCTFGIISHPKRYFAEEGHEFIQHDVAINPGNSGGALINMKGKLIGINTLKLFSKEDIIDNMGFAIPSNLVYSVITNLEAKARLVGFPIINDSIPIDINKQMVLKKEERFI